MSWIIQLASFFMISSTCSAYLGPSQTFPSKKIVRVEFREGHFFTANDHFYLSPTDKAEEAANLLSFEPKSPREKAQLSRLDNHDYIWGSFIVDSEGRFYLDEIRQVGLQQLLGSWQPDSTSMATLKFESFTRGRWNNRKINYSVSPSNSPGTWNFIIPGQRTFRTGTLSLHLPYAGAPTRSGQLEMKFNSDQGTPFEPLYLLKSE